MREDKRPHIADVSVPASNEFQASMAVVTRLSSPRKHESADFRAFRGIVVSLPDA
jgi:hypothetical protein